MLPPPEPTCGPHSLPIGLTIRSHGTHGIYGLRYVFCASVFCAYSVFSDKQNTLQFFEGANVLCIAYCVFSCNLYSHLKNGLCIWVQFRIPYSVFRIGSNVLGAVPYSVFRIPYSVFFVGGTTLGAVPYSVFRIPYSVLAASFWAQFRIPYSVFCSGVPTLGVVPYSVLRIPY